MGIEKEFLDLLFSSHELCIVDNKVYFRASDGRMIVASESVLDFLDDTEDLQSRFGGKVVRIEAFNPKLRGKE